MEFFQGRCNTVVFIACAVFATAGAAQEIPAHLTLRDALSLALEHSPALEAYSYGVRAAEARALQAGLRPNPELEFEIEEIRFSDGGDTTTRAFDNAGVLQEQEIEDGPDAGLDNAELTLSLSQLIELGRKRAKRIAAGEQNVAATTWDYEIARVNVLAEVAHRFVLALAAQQKAALAEEALKRAQAVHRTIEARVEAGAASPIEASRAQLETGTAGIDVDQAQRAVQSTHAALAAAIGIDKASITEVVGDIETVPPSIPWNALQESIVEIPESRRWLAEVALRESELALERAQRWPDLTVTGGWRMTNLDDTRFNTFDAAGTPTGFGNASPDDDRAHSFLVSFSLPIPLFDRNQGGIREAEYLVSKAEAESRASGLRLESALYQAWQTQAAAAERVTRFRSAIVPQAEEIFAATDEGYREGKFDYLAVLDAQRTLFETRAQLTAAQADGSGKACVRRA